MSNTVQLKEILLKSHYNAALKNGNASSKLIKDLGAMGIPFTQATIGAISSLGGLHGATLQARRLIFGDYDNRIDHGYRLTMKIPGFGNSFYKDQIDPSFARFVTYLQEVFPRHYEHLMNINDKVNNQYGIKIYPNPASFTAIAADLLNLEFGTEISLLIEARMPAWAQLWAEGQASYPGIVCS